MTSSLESIDWHGFLERPPLAKTAQASIAALTRKTVLLTGAGGSLGLPLAMKLASEGVRLVLLEAAEPALFDLQCRLGAVGAQIRHSFYLGSATDCELLKEIFQSHQPAIVFHTAAFKHVSLLEEQPLAAIRNNVFGTELVAAESSAHRARMVLLSTDKAVAPRSIMGATKRAAERIVLAANGFVVRLANVLGSRGSVSEVFAQQIAMGRALTVTDEAAERYFLTLCEAVELLLDAAVHAEDGTIVVPDLKRAHRVADLARFIADTLAPGSELPITITGLRPGEKLTERLWSPDESVRPDQTKGILRIAPAVPDRGCMHQRLRALEQAVMSRKLDAALHSLCEIVPDYEPSATVLDQAATPAVVHE